MSSLRKFLIGSFTGATMGASIAVAQAPAPVPPALARGEMCENIPMPTDALRGAFAQCLTTGGVTLAPDPRNVIPADMATRAPLSEVVVRGCELNRAGTEAVCEVLSPIDRPALPGSDSSSQRGNLFRYTQDGVVTTTDDGRSVGTRSNEFRFPLGAAPAV